VLREFSCYQRIASVGPSLPSRFSRIVRFAILFSKTRRYRLFVPTCKPIPVTQTNSNGFHYSTPRSTIPRVHDRYISPTYKLSGQNFFLLSRYSHLGVHTENALGIKTTQPFTPFSVLFIHILNWPRSFRHPANNTLRSLPLT
jgi:hypothetical protein